MEQTTIDAPHAVAPLARTACAIAVDGPTRGVFELPAGVPIAIGRSHSSEIRVDDPAVSRLHATLTWDGASKIDVADHGSRNGTWIGDKRVSGEGKASNNDTVRVGPTTLLVLVPAAVSSPERRGAMDRTNMLAERAASCDLGVLILGETGVGKEVLARRIHDASHRSKGPFVAVHCGAIPETLAESTLFGHERGSFTGADQRKEGVLEAAAGGTLFLDEVGELSTSNQVRLLRALEERTVTRVGGTRSIPVDVRVIAATHRDLDRAVGLGTFRRDLLYRLDVLRIDVPPLRARLEELPDLARTLLAEIAPTMTITDDAIRVLENQPFPGNVRELRNLLARAATMAEGHTLDRRTLADVLPPTSGASEGPLKGRVGDAERRAIEEALAATGGNQTHAAARLGISRRGLIYKMERYGLKPRKGS